MCGVSQLMETAGRDNFDGIEFVLTLRLSKTGWGKEHKSVVVAQKIAETIERQILRGRLEQKRQIEVLDATRVI
ncbi:MAG: hypothetical protein MHM6MM_008719 [Cercozoa sp. M6MM]